MKTLILSGFEKFGEYIDNSSKQVALALGGGMLVDFHVESEILLPKISIMRSYAKELLERSRERGNCPLICLGMSSAARGLRVETLCYNLSQSKYCPSDLNGLKLDQSMDNDAGIDLDLSSWDIKSAAAACAQKGIEILDSTDPGRFCCNALMFYISLLQRDSTEYQNIPWIFIHIPCSLSCIGDATDFINSGKKLMEPSRIVQGLREVIVNFRNK